MMDGKRVNELDLLAYADGLLDDEPLRKAAVEAALAADPEAMARAEAFRAQTEALRAAYGWRLAEPVPERLSAVLERPQQWRPGAALRAAALVMLTLGAGTAGWMMGQEDHDGAERAAARLAEQSVDRFVASSDGEAATRQLASADTGGQLDLLTEDVSFRLETPDLSAAGYALAGKDVVTTDGGRIVRLDYAARDGRSFSLFLAPRQEERQDGIAQAERGGVSMAYWLDGPLASTVVARMPPDETRGLAEAVRQAMHADGKGPVLEPDASGRGATSRDLMADSLPSPALDAHPQMLRTIDQGQVQPN